MTQFDEDLSRETEVIQNLQPVFQSFFNGYTVKTNKTDQKRGVDVVAEYNSEQINIDVKSQLDYLNDPLETFVLEIFSETNTESNNVGWFINKNLDTHYYMFTRFPRVDQFEIDRTFNFVKYYPYQELTEVPSFMRTPTEEYTSPNEYRYAFSFDDISKFCEQYYQINKNKILGKSLNGKFFTENSIRKQDAILLDKTVLQDELAKRGLTRTKLVTDAQKVDETGENKSYEYDDIHSMYVSNRHGERPINLVVDYDFYTTIAERQGIVCLD